MTISEAIAFLRPAIHPTKGSWADIGAGTGIFTEALMNILTEGEVYAIDKSPHALYKIQTPPHIHFEIVEADFNQPMPLPLMDGILMANALHYAPDHLQALRNVLQYLKPAGVFVLIEYDTEIPVVPWVPNPFSVSRFEKLCGKMGLMKPQVLDTRGSIYNDGRMYLAMTRREDKNE